jgi:hypothetical protein
VEIRSLIPMLGLVLLADCLSKEDSPPAPPGSGQRRSRLRSARTSRALHQATEPKLALARRRAGPAWQQVARRTWLAGPPLAIDEATPLARVLKDPAAFAGKRVRVGGTAERCGSELLLEDSGEVLAVRPPLALGPGRGSSLQAEGELRVEAKTLEASLRQCPRAARARAVLLATSLSIGAAGPQ